MAGALHPETVDGQTLRRSCRIRRPHSMQMSCSVARVGWSRMAAKPREAPVTPQKQKENRSAELAT